LLAGNQAVAVQRSLGRYLNCLDYTVSGKCQLNGFVNVVQVNRMFVVSLNVIAQLDAAVIRNVELVDLHNHIIFLNDVTHR